MRLTKSRQQDELEGPSGVRIRHGDGSESECVLFRDPDDGPGGTAAWMALLRGGRLFDAADSLCWDVLPRNASLRVVASVPEWAAGVPQGQFGWRDLG